MSCCKRHCSGSPNVARGACRSMMADAEHDLGMVLLFLLDMPHDRKPAHGHSRQTQHPFLLTKAFLTIFPPQFHTPSLGPVKTRFSFSP